MPIYAKQIDNILCRKSTVLKEITNVRTITNKCARGFAYAKIYHFS